MSNKLICIMAMAFVLGWSGGLIRAQENQIVNSEFDDGLTGWGRYGATGFDVVVVQNAGLSGANAVLLDITDAAATASIGIAQSGLLLEPGVTYPIGFTARAQQSREMVVLLQTNLNNVSWPTQVERRVNLTTTAQTYVIEYTHTGDTLGDDPGESVNLYLMLKGAWWPMVGDDLNTKVWIDRVYFGAEPPLPRRDLPTNPEPGDSATDVWRDTRLAWTPGAFAQRHDVYFGTVFEDVNEASRANPMGVLLSQGQSADTYDPGRLELGQTYYWRIDEINAPPDSTVVRGPVWSFTVEPATYPITAITATSDAASPDTSGPEKTIDGSGLDANDQHSTTSNDMWLGQSADGEPVWIQYEFDRVYKLHEMLVWNYNVQFELLLGFGVKDAKVEYSTDGLDWTSLGDVQLAQAEAQATYRANTTIDFEGIAARYVRLTVLGGWGMLGQYGLSEVRFLYSPAHATRPLPTDGTADVDVATALRWRPGRDAALHRVYIDTDPDTVTDGTAPAVTVGDNLYRPDTVEFGGTYYWRVDEVNEAEPIALWEGDVWSFSMQPHAVIDDFEGYTDNLEAGEAIFDTWLDGWVNGTGSTVGYLDTPFAERSIIHGGVQSMPLAYDNTTSPWYSEAERTWDAPQDWTVFGADTLTVHFRGNPPAFLETAEGHIVMGAIGADIWGTADQFRFAYKSLNGNGSIVARVESIANTWPWAKGGVMIRERIDPGAAHAMVVLTPENGVALQYRPTMNGPSLSVDEPGPVAPYWVKLTRSGNTFTAERSEDGVNWVSITADPAASSVQISMATNVYIGLAVTSTNANAVTGAEFSAVATTGNVTGQWQTASIGREQPEGNAAEPLYVAVEDNAGNTAVVPHPDPLAVLRAEWQAWRIPLSEFHAAGVRMNSVRTMFIGVGDRNNPTAGGAGLVYIDDILFGRPAAD
ncbi:discoidin domain-containing protein [Anaerobaca lacustris]|uniref:Discoidin domain-containing protein n=1 Tax=Anaerobaca lacustris TaxID=3044600 RepID=A0AAW6U2D9_9BACT|nr:discoidin domain-containing protein [Sedimentisphaerales bacterium M17dextr]